jgi:hypothetical protein
MNLATLFIKRAHGSESDTAVVGAAGKVLRFIGSFPRARSVGAGNAEATKNTPDARSLQKSRRVDGPMLTMPNATEAAGRCLSSGTTIAKVTGAVQRVRLLCTRPFGRKKREHDRDVQMIPPRLPVWLEESR